MPVVTTSFGDTRSDGDRGEVLIDQTTDAFLNRMLLFMLSIVLLIPFCVSMDGLLQLNTETLCVVASVCMPIIIWIVLSASSRDVWSPSFMYASVFCMFHFGMAFVVAIGAHVHEDLVAYMDRWFYSAYTKEAILLATVGLIAYSVGACAASVVGAERRQQLLHQIRRFKASDEHVGRVFTIVGFGLVSGSVGLWYLTVLRSGGISVLMIAYQDYLAVTAEVGSSLANYYFLLGLGCILLSAAPPSRLKRTGFWIFGIWAATVLPLGLRGEVFFPTCTALAISAKRSRPISTKTALILGVCSLSACAFIKTYRATGFKDLDLSQTRISPFAALAEMGGSIRPVSLAVQWRDEGDPLILGASYWAPFDRAVRRVVPGWEPPEAEEDFRLMDVVTQTRVGPVGFSPVAEAYCNFGPAGVLSVMFLTGFVLGYLDSIAIDYVRAAILGMVFFPLLYSVRNAFIQVPVQILGGLGLVFLLVQLAKLRPGANSMTIEDDTHGKSEMNGVS